MPKEVQLWTIGTGDRLRVLPPGRLDLESRLEDWLAADIGVLDPSLMVIGRQIRTDHGAIIDLLCMTKTGDLAVVELKRDLTPREITAQALDYGSWVKDLSVERITSIAEDYLSGQHLEDAFEQHFGIEMPESLNSDHRLLIVGSEIDPATERIVRYLSDTHGVNINVATFQYFKGPEGSEILARVFLIEQSQVEMQTRTRGASKRRPYLTDEALAGQASENGVAELYRASRSALSEHFGLVRTQTGLTFQQDNKAVLSLIPGESSDGKGLRFNIYHRRIARIAGRTPEQIQSTLPPGCEAWNQFPKSPDPDYQGLRGFFRKAGDVDRLIAAMNAHAAG